MNLDLSLILPHFNSKALAERKIIVLDEKLKNLGLSYEIIIVDDGSIPEEQINVQHLPATAKLILLPKNIGKGAAISRGMLAAQGKVRIFTDIDLPYDLSAVHYAYTLIQEKDFHFVAGDRSLPNSKYDIPGPMHRRIASKIFSKMITLLIIGGIYDSQCGFKAFSAELTEALFPLLTIQRFSFDVEIYYLLLKYNVTIRRIPVCLRNQEGSTVNLFKHALPMALRTLSIPFKWYAGKYQSKAMSAFLDNPYWE
jgi:dolichyl-phosphate beta-glucosyltransferase